MLTILDKDLGTLVVDQAESPKPIKFLSTVGLSYDSYCSAMGKAMLSGLTVQRLEQYINNTEFKANTPTTITDKEQFKKEIEMITRTGVAYDNEESVIGLICIACPIFSCGGRLEGSIGISGVKFRMTNGNRKLYTKALKQSAESLSHALGYVCVN